jgi:predicted aspartyl protease
MQINGEWLLCDDGIVRPVIRGEILAANGTWHRAELLVDTGADRTVFSAATLAMLSLQPLVAQERISGLGGAAKSVVVETQIRFTREEAGKVVRKKGVRSCNHTFPFLRNSRALNFRLTVA